MSYILSMIVTQEDSRLFNRAGLYFFDRRCRNDATSILYIRVSCDTGFIERNRSEVPGEAFVSMKFMIEGKAYVKEDFETAFVRDDISDVPNLESVILVILRELDFQFRNPQRIPAV